MVLTLGVGGFDVCRILVVLGSSADLLQMLAYKPMGYFSFALENPSCILIGFNGASIVSLGDVIFPIQAGLVTLNVCFSIVENLSPYKAIMRQVWLHKMKVIPSTYHQMISYLTEVRQVDLIGSQLATRQCYQVIVEAEQINPTRNELESLSAKSQ